MGRAEEPQLLPISIAVPLMSSKRLYTIHWLRILSLSSSPLLKGGPEKMPIGRRQQENGAGERRPAVVGLPQALLSCLVEVVREGRELQERGGE